MVKAGRKLGLEKFKFQLALQTSSSQIVLALGKSQFTFITICLAEKSTCPDDQTALSIRPVMHSEEKTISIFVISFSSSLIIHQAKTKKTLTVKEVWKPSLN